MARTKLAVALALVGAALSPNANALGLGAVDVQSSLNQPLSARIPLYPANPEEIETLTVSLASAEAFQRAGVDRPFSLTQLRFQVVRGDNPYVRVFTEQPVKEPFLDFLIEADWAKGRLVREFTLLLDPPVYGGAGVVAPAVAIPTGQPAAAQQRVTPGAATATAAVPSTTVAALPAAGGPGPVRYGPVTANDTLWKIANRVRPDESVSVNQTMVALLRANPDAFIRGDMNRLKRGAVLHVPDLATIAAIDGGEANREVRAHVQRWRQQMARRAERGHLQVLAPAGQRGEQANAATPEPTPEGQAATEQLEQELKLYRESNLSLEAENAELRAQVEALKQEVAHFERLIQLQMQQPTVTTSAAESPAVEAPPVPEEEVAVEAPEEPVAEQPAIKSAPAPIVPPVQEPGFLDDPRNLGMLGGVALALLGLLYMSVRRRRLAAAEAEEPVEIVAATASAAAPAEEPEAEQDPDTPVAEGNELGDLPPEGDALSEADVYLAYGRHDQARDVIEKALRNEPDRIDLQLKQLEILAQMQDADGFAVAAGVLHGLVDDDHPAWARARELGRELIPTHPLFADAEQEAETAEATAAADELDIALDFPAFDPDQSASAAAEARTEADTVAEQAEDEFTLDFELPELEPASPEPEEAKAAEAGLDFELGDLTFDDTPTAEADNVLEFSQPERAEEADQSELLEELDEAGVKLDLARAYLDMGDNEGARSLLDEVLAEGSSAQRQEAENLLKEIA